MRGDTGGSKRRKGRAEQALEHALQDRPDINTATRTALRIQAHALDLAEWSLWKQMPVANESLFALLGPLQVPLACLLARTLLPLLKANGLTSDRQDTGDPFERLMADLSRAATTTGDSPQP